MILELADIRIHPGQNAAFDEAIARGLRDVIAHAKGYRGFKVNKGIESPERYVLQIVWATLSGWIFFGQLPDTLTFIGMGIICLTGIGVMLVERRGRAPG